MMDYDRVAWGTTDLLGKEAKESLKRVSPVWFCLRKDNVWYAIYGTNGSLGYDIAFCYREASRDKFEKVPPPAFPDKDRFAKAIDTALPEILDIARRTTVRFNYYIRSEQGGIAVYFLPAFQTDGQLAFGVQHTYLFDATGAKLVSHERHGSTLYGIHPGKGRTVTLEMTECAVPTPQAFFTMMSYRDDFADVVTHCQDGYYGLDLKDGVYTCVRRPVPPPTFPSF